MTDMPEWRHWADIAHLNSLHQSQKHGKARFKCSNPTCGHRTSEGLAKKNGWKCFSCKSDLKVRLRP